ncbi:MAG: M28 family metallopeptidase [Spirochaetota bacterium]
MSRVRFCLLFLLAISSPAFGQGGAPTAPIPEIRSAGMLTDIEWLAGAHFDGRLTGSRGNAAAARALAERLAELGGEPLPGADSLLESYEQPVVRIAERPRMSLSAGGRAAAGFEPGVDFDILVREGTRISGPVTARVVELTEEHATPEWIAAHRECALVISSRLFGELTREDRLMQALFHPSEGPAAVILGMPPGLGPMPRSLFLTADDYPPVGPMLIQMTHEAAERLLTFVAAPGRRASERQPTVTVHGGYAVETVTVTNVAAVLPATSSPATEGDADAVGSDDDPRAPAPRPRTSDTSADAPGTATAPAPASALDAPPIVLSAHFDGPGRIAESWHYPGAIDNASGVAVVLEVARMIAESDRGGPRPVWVVFFNGEEQGMRGSTAFVSAHGEHLPGARIINVDMAGLSGVPVSVTRTADATELAARALERLGEVDLEARVIEGGGSDHASFAGLAPAVSLVQSPYRRMHRPTDSDENADGRTLEAIARALFGLIADEVDADASPAVGPTDHRIVVARLFDVIDG